MTTHQPPRETNVSVTLSIRDWLIMGSMFAGLIAWGVRLEMRIGAVEANHSRLENTVEKIDDRVDHIATWHHYGPNQPGQGGNQ